MPSDDLSYWLAFSQIKKLNNAQWQRIIKYFPNLKTAWHSNLMDLSHIGLPEDLAHEIIIARQEISPEKEWENFLKLNIKITRFIDDDYPPLLKEIHDWPPLLFYQGELSALDKNCLAVVGARKHTAYGQQIINEILPTLTSYGITIVSGLALGIDALAHQATLDSGGLTVAILGTGVDNNSIYPATNRRLAQKIIDSGGAVISEYPPGSPGAKYTFPQRNRIIAGLSLGTLIIEAKEISGSLITAKQSLEYNREVFAMPGSIFSPSSAGTNNLIKQGAKIVIRAEDILEELNLQQSLDLSSRPTYIPQSTEENIILEILTKEAMHIDKLAQISKLRINVLESNLIMMELKNIIKDLGGKNYIKNL